jgi:Ala-tRNA(Pro) deacylase
MDYHPITREVEALLTREGCWYETFEHPPVRTSEEAARVRPGYQLADGAKAIVARARESGGSEHLAMLVFGADRRFDSKRARHILGVKDIRFATHEEVATATGGVQPGGIPPFGNLFGLPVVVDRALLERERIVFNAGDQRFSVAMKTADYRRLVNPTVADLT